MATKRQLIANPMYDAVFKALMEDVGIARGLLSVILGMKIVGLRMVSNEGASCEGKEGPSGESAEGERTDVLPGLLRMDFCAVIRTESAGLAGLD